MKISPTIYASMLADIRTVAQSLQVNVATSDGGKTGLRTMYALLDIVSRNRAYDQNHPHFASGVWPRLLPYDGREYCFYYADGCNDSHVATALRHIKEELSQP